MGHQAVYERFLASRSPLSLAENATYQYVTTLKSFSQQGAIIRHLETQQNNVVKKKSEKVISAVEGLTSVALILETTLEFISSGGAYLPGLDTFIIDRTATLPVVSVHMPLLERPLLISPDALRPLRPGWQDHADTAQLGPGRSP